MLKLKILNILTFIIYFSTVISAQKDVEFTHKNFQDNIKLERALIDIQNGDVYFEIGPGAYRIAVKFYLRANNLNPANSELNYKIGRCYLHSDDKEEAIEYLKKSLTLQSKNKYPTKYFLGLAYNHNYQFKDAIIVYNDFLKTISGKIEKEYRKRAEKGILEAEKALKLIKNPVVDSVNNLGSQINSEYADYSPVLSANGETLFFTSRRKPVNVENIAYDSTDFQFFEDTYSATNGLNQWRNIKHIGASNIQDFHNAIISKMGSVEIHYMADNQGDLYIKYKNKGAKPFPESINSEYSETSAILSADGKTLYFISNRKKDNFGGKDIYYSEIDNNGNWGDAVNMGDVINSEYDEDGLYMHHKDNVLFFSSKRQGSMGGYDIFKTTRYDSVWTKPENIGYPINTPANDIHFTISPDCKTLYFASDRKGGQGMHDIYSCQVNDKILHRNFLNGTVTSFDGNVPLEATVKLYDKYDKEIYVKKTNKKDGKFSGAIPVGKNHTLVVNSENYLVYSEKIDVNDTNLCYFSIKKSIKLTKAVKGNAIVLGAVEFDFASVNIRETSYIALNNIADYIISNPTMKVEIGGHTDNKGTNKYNMSLSKNRAKSIVDYLKSKKVPVNQLSYKGYSFEKPIAENETEEGRQKNRRVEFTIIDK